MAVSSGDQLGPYQIVMAIGAGGMGEVYRAHDPRMGRDVALKLSQERFSERFDREVRAVAALSHPNICTIHDVGPNYYVMELVEGPTLADRIEQGPIPLDEALEIAGQIAEALEAAHEKGIIHRDLKPANIKLRPDGTVKVLDFGLAKLAGSPEAAASGGADGATMTMGSTQAGAILGTAAYMSPEQARGKPVDRRTDTWAFGAVLYEMLTGKQAFGGETVTDVLAAVVQGEPDWKLVPETVRPLLQRCLEKDPKRRLREAADGLLLLGGVAQQPAAPASKRFGLISSVTAAALFLALVALALIYFGEKPRPVQTVRFQFPLPPKVTFTRSGIFAISPDGRKVAFSAFGADGVPRIWIRDLASLTARELPNVETPQALYALFWSPDSRFLAVQSDGKLKKVDIASGTAQDICDVSGTLYGGSWSRDGVILFSSYNGRQAASIVRVAATGGTPVLAVAPAKGDNSPLYPVFLPDGKHFLYSRGAGTIKRSIYGGSLDAKPEEQSRTALVQSDYSFAYSPGHLLFLRGGALLEQPFDEKRLRLVGEPVPVANAVGSDDGPAFGHISASANGSLVYLPATSGTWQLTWFNRNGEVIGKPVQTEEFRMLKLSPDGSKAAVEREQVFAGQSSIWVIDLVLGTNSRLSFGSGYNGAPVWSPDGSRIAWRALRNGKWAIYQKAANGAGDEELLYQFSDGGDAATPALTDWSHDGRFLIFRQRADMWALPVGPGTGSDRKPLPLIQSPEFKQGAYLSSDGRWLAYLSNESGRPEIYVQGVGLSSPNSGKWIVSKGASGLARWRADSKELMFLSADGVLMAVPLAGGSVFQPSPWQTLFKLPPEFLRLATNPGVLADVTRDNQKILLSMPVEGSGQELSVVLNWETASGK